MPDNNRPSAAKAGRVTHTAMTAMCATVVDALFCWYGDTQLVVLINCVEEEVSTASSVVGKRISLCKATCGTRQQLEVATSLQV